MKVAGWDRDKCQICGGSLMHPDEIKLRYHQRCFDQWKKNNKV